MSRRPFDAPWTGSYDQLEAQRNRERQEADSRRRRRIEEARRSPVRLWVCDSCGCEDESCVAYRGALDRVTCRPGFACCLPKVDSSACYLPKVDSRPKLELSTEQAPRNIPAMTNLGHLFWVWADGTTFQGKELYGEDFDPDAEIERATLDAERIGQEPPIAVHFLDECTGEIDEDFGTVARWGRP